MIEHFFPCAISNWKYHEEACFSLYFLFIQVYSHAKGRAESKGRPCSRVLMQGNGNREQITSLFSYLTFFPKKLLKSFDAK